MSSTRPVFFVAVVANLAPDPTSGNKRIEEEWRKALGDGGGGVLHPPALDNLPPYSVFFVRSGDEDGKEEVDILCSGTLIDWQYVVTSAYCMKENEKDMSKTAYLASKKVRSGNDSVEVRVKKVVYQPSYSHYTRSQYSGKNDLALVQLNESVGYRNATILCVSPQFVGDKTFEKLTPRKFLHVTATGSKSDDARDIHDIRMKYVSPYQCDDTEWAMSIKRSLGRNKEHYVVCSKSKFDLGPCEKHDLGSGLVAKTALDNGEVIVHLIAVLLNSDDADCDGGPDIVSYYLLLAEFHAWLKLKVGKDVRCKEGDMQRLMKLHSDRAADRKRSSSHLLLVASALAMAAVATNHRHDC